MRRSIYFFICYLFLASGYVQADFESDVIDLVNVERAAQGQTFLRTLLPFVALPVTCNQSSAELPAAGLVSV